MMNQSVRFTIVTVTFNAEDCLERTLQSVLNQSYKNIEYLVIDGGSKDRTVDIIRKYEPQLFGWISEKDNGIYDGMNKGIQMASGDYLLFMNADDTFASSSVLEQIADYLLQIEALPDVVYGDYRLQTKYGEYHKAPGDIHLLDRKWVISHQATFVRVPLLKERPFDLNYRLCGDFDMLSEFYLKGYKFEYVPIEIAAVPIASGTSFNNFAASKREHYSICKKRGVGSRLQTEVMIFRAAVAHFIRWILPQSWSDYFFKILAKYYKVM